MSNTLKMVFTTDQDKTYTYTISGVKDNLDGVGTVMDKIIQSEVIYSVNGNLNGKKSASLTVTDKREFDVI